MAAIILAGKRLFVGFHIIITISIEFYFPFGLYKVAIETPPRIKAAPIKMNHDNAPEKYSGKNNDRNNEKATPQDE